MALKRRHCKSVKVKRHSRENKGKSSKFWDSLAIVPRYDCMEKELRAFRNDSPSIRRKEVLARYRGLDVVQSDKEVVTGENEGERRQGGGNSSEWMGRWQESEEEGR